MYLTIVTTENGAISPDTMTHLTKDGAYNYAKGLWFELKNFEHLGKIVAKIWDTEKDVWTVYVDGEEVECSPYGNISL